MLYQLFGESLSFSDGHNGIIEYLRWKSPKSLDSIHLASAKMAGADWVTTFDREMEGAAKTLGLKA